MSNQMFYCDPRRGERIDYAELIALLLEPQRAAAYSQPVGQILRWLTQVGRGEPLVRVREPLPSPDNQRNRTNQTREHTAPPAHAQPAHAQPAHAQPAHTHPAHAPYQPHFESDACNNSATSDRINAHWSTEAMAWLRTYTGSIDSLDRHRWQQWWLDSPSQIVLHTSGSSGQPQSFRHSLSSLTRGVQCSTSHAGDVWGWCYPADHLAGIQVLWQALLNGNPLIQLYGQPADTIHGAIDEFRITHLSCTPTFARLMLTSSKQHPSVQRLTLGGERFDPKLVPAIRAMFPQAQMRNIYAATETGPLFISRDDRFEIPPALQPWLQIRDGELWLHQRLRVDQPDSLSDWRSAAPPPADDLAYWPTGDQVEIVATDPLTIRFVSRKTEGFNVAGFRVDPTRLESIARTYPAVANARFFGVPNSVTEHLVACELMLRESQSDPTVAWDAAAFRTWLAGQVARHEIPRIIEVVSEIGTTDSGKVKRR